MQYLLQTSVIEGKLKDASWDYWKNTRHYEFSTTLKLISH